MIILPFLLGEYLIAFVIRLLKTSSNLILSANTKIMGDDKNEQNQ